MMSLLTPDENLAHLRSQVVKYENLLREAVEFYCPGTHKVTAHRDGHPPWCNACGRDARGIMRKKEKT